MLSAAAATPLLMPLHACDYAADDAVDNVHTLP